MTTRQDTSKARATFSDNLGALPVSKAINHLYGTTETELARPDDACQTLVLLAESGTFRSRPGACKARTFAASAVHTDTEIIDIATHGYETGDGPFLMTTDTTLPTVTGINLSTTPVYVIKVDAGHIKIASTLANALAGTAANITAAGTGNHVLGGLPTTPGASVVNGQGSLLISTGDWIVLSAPDKITVKGDGATATLTYWWV